ncbi:hypothetical protein EYC80_006648 [Monilinia laxa]|uniref:Uncharacterized protein n=1 Tax=Monilinia laxa TaxID=61186 RepID=A0A5N6JU01_MONLA|nr:hypothetical protein EYC80_006648 [Monilinia laxa]
MIMRYNFEMENKENGISHAPIRDVSCAVSFSREKLPVLCLFSPDLYPKTLTFMIIKSIPPAPSVPIFVPSSHSLISFRFHSPPSYFSFSLLESFLSIPLHLSSAKHPRYVSTPPPNDIISLTLLSPN